MEYSAKYFIELLENYKASKNYTKNKDNIEADAIEKISEDNDIPECEIIEMLMEYAEQMKQDNGLK